MNKKRCFWANPKNQKYLDYHDFEWGKIVKDDKTLFEFLVLEGAQAGLSWETVLNKRGNYKELFFDYDLEKIIKLEDFELEEILKNPGIIRNRLKVFSVRKNAKIFIEMQKEFGSFYNYLWNFVGGKQIIGNLKSKENLKSSTELSDKISKDLKKRGMTFVGSTIIYAYLQAVGIVNDHFFDCDFR